MHNVMGKNVFLQNLQRKVNNVKKSLIILFMLAEISWNVRVSQAALIEINNNLGHVVFDNQADMYWYWDLTEFVNQTYNQQIDSISALSLAGYYGITTWYMATQNEIDILRLNDLSSIGQSFVATDFHFQCPDGEECPNWIGRYDRLYEAGDGTDHYLYAVFIPPWDTSNYYENSHGVSDLNPADNLGAWIVSVEGPVSTPIPEPGTLLLLGSGGLASLALRRRFQRSRV